MRIGTRWAAGTVPPAAIPAPMAEAIRRAEAEDSTLSTGMWTLTFLEQRPIATHELGTVIDPGAPTVDDEDDWLA